MCFQAYVDSECPDQPAQEQDDLNMHFFAHVDSNFVFAWRVNINSGFQEKTKQNNMYHIYPKYLDR